MFEFKDIEKLEAYLGIKKSELEQLSLLVKIHEDAIFNLEKTIKELRENNKEIS